jgi:hypothetical protein
MDTQAQVGGVPVGQTSWIELDLSTLAGSAYYDPTANTLRLLGSVSLKAPTAVTLSFTENVPVNLVPQPATVSVYFSLPSVLTFDSGDLALNGPPLQFTPPPIPISGAYTILAGSQTFTGFFHYSLQFQNTTVAISDVTSTSFVINPGQSIFSFPAPVIVRGLAAANGMVFNLIAGISDPTYSARWLPGPITARLAGAS